MFDLIEDGRCAKETIATTRGVELVEYMPQGEGVISWEVIAPDCMVERCANFQDACDTFQRWCELY